MLICGKYVTSNKTANMVTNNGNSGFITVCIFTLATLQPINSTDPTGGVHRPTHRFNTIIMPKCIGSIPSWVVTIGKNMGVKIRLFYERLRSSSEI